MKQYFYLDESPMYKEKLLLRMNHDLFKFPKGTSGSYAVFVSRVLGLSYPDYLRFARDILGAEIIGKGDCYPVAYFKLSQGLADLIEELNARANLVLWEREHPDFEEHAAYVKEKSPRFYAEVTGNVSNT